MTKDKTVEDIMVGISEYPHVPYWFAISKAVEIVRLSLYGGGSYPVPMVALVFDERYDLMGILSLRDLLKGLKGPEKAADRPVSAIMSPLKFHVEPFDGIRKAADLMIQNDLEMLPVIEDQRHFVGLVRIAEVFDELLNEI
ncbi:MAG: CBS domain-containing protein [Nitrospirae bacterium]|nr:CBS domain-containing protein [Nitrospirota bacterium]